ncbi:Metallo-dependent phosphatase [Rhizoctonia solani]|uniref:Metallo-dependent phosphatase n=1 Tax=Rhizoctonia solani TaxID=456999 RepID=A0A8H7GXH7_9AGAM|nr:Metallo-dependent phosphatase [Rhizoctonia solani]
MMTRHPERQQDNKSVPVIHNGELTNLSFDHVIRFADKIEEIRGKHGADETQDEYKSLLLFSGDLFSPSVESLLTRGGNMVHLMNELGPDACVPGNHEFDFGRERFDRLIEFSNFPWLLSNIEQHPLNEKHHPDYSQRIQIDGLRKYLILERCGLKIGIIGLVSDDTLKKTNTESKALFALDPMNHPWSSKDEPDKWGPLQRLVAELRRSEKDSGKGCDLVFALTHALVNEDIELAKQASVFAASSKRGDGLEHIPGIDIIFGGHDHHYWVSNGVPVEGLQPELSEKEKSESKDTLIVKSGTNFQDLSEVMIQVEERPNGTERKYVVTSVKGEYSVSLSKGDSHTPKVKRHRFEPIELPKEGAGPAKIDDTQQKHIQTTSTKKPMARVLKRQFDNEVLAGLKTPVAVNEDQIVIDESKSRSEETVVGNWIADVMLRWYEHLWDATEISRPRAFVTCGGAIRGQRNLEPGTIFADEIIQLHPFDTPLVAVDVEGQHLKTALDGAFSSMKFEDGKYKAGAFPVVSGMKVEWNIAPATGPQLVRLYINNEHNVLEEVVDSKVYRILTIKYLADGNDGYSGRKNKDGSKPLGGFNKATIVQRYEEIPPYQFHSRLTMPLPCPYADDLSALQVHDSAWASISNQFTRFKRFLGSSFDHIFELAKREGESIKQREKQAIMRAPPPKQRLISGKEKLPKLDIPKRVDHRVVHVDDA